MTNAHVLIVEDDGITARYVQGCLRGHGIGAATVATSGREALRQAAALEPDLMLVDIRLREDDLDGVETVRRLRQHSDVPVIYLTGYSDDDTIRRAEATSPQGYIVKPFHQRELVTAVDIALGSRRRAVAQAEPYQSIVESQVEMVCRFQPDGTLTYVNGACCQAFGQPREALLGASFWSLIAPPDREAVQRRVALLGCNCLSEVHEHRALAHRLVPSAVQPLASREPPELRWQQWSILALVDAQGHVTEYQAVGRDISEHKQREMDLGARLGELQEALARRHSTRGLVPICASCKRIRNKQEEWEVLEGYMHEHYGIDFTHGLCPECLERLYPGYPAPGAEDGPAPDAKPEE